MQPRLYLRRHLPDRIELPRGGRPRGRRRRVQALPVAAARSTATPLHRMNADTPTTLPDAAPRRIPAAARRSSEGEAAAARRPPRRDRGADRRRRGGGLPRLRAAGSSSRAARDRAPQVHPHLRHDHPQQPLLAGQDPPGPRRARGVRGLYADVDDIGVELEGFKVKRIITAGARVVVEDPRRIACSSSRRGPTATPISTASGRGQRRGDLLGGHAGRGAVALAPGRRALCQRRRRHLPHAERQGGRPAHRRRRRGVVRRRGHGHDHRRPRQRDHRRRAHPRRASPQEAPATAALTLRPIKLASLGAPLGLALPAPGAVAEGSAALTLGNRAGRSA